MPKLLLYFLIIKLVFSEDNWLFSYKEDSENGPTNWHKNEPACNGEKQSPINIMTSNVIHQSHLGYLHFAKTGPVQQQLQLKKSRTTVTVEFNGLTNRLSGGGLKNNFTLAQLHFHWSKEDTEGSEHTIDGVSYPLEIHFVHWNSDKYFNTTLARDQPDGLAVLGVFVQIKNENIKKERVSKGLEEIIERLSDATNNQDSRELPKLNFESLFPDSKDFYRYHGSLTTPPCYESVTWTVFKDPIFVHKHQLDKFKEVKLGLEGEEKLNFRPPQRLNNRHVYHCCADSKNSIPKEL